MCRFVRARDVSANGQFSGIARHGLPILILQRRGEVPYRCIGVVGIADFQELVVVLRLTEGNAARVVFGRVGVTVGRV